MELPNNLAVYALLFFGFCSAFPVNGQFKEIGPPPFPPAVAHQKIRKLLDTVDPGNRKQTIATLSSWVAWYRDILDEELIAAWKRDSRANLPELIEALGDARVASEVVAFSWREGREATFNLKYAPLLTNLMSRYARSADPFLQDIRQKPELTQAETEAVCRILIDMPDVGTWRESALKILPRYSDVAKSLLTQDLHAGDEDRMFRAEMWLAELKMNSPAAEPRQQSRRRNVSPPTDPDPPTEAPRRIHVDGPPVQAETEPRLPPRAVLPSVPVPQTKFTYDGPKSGTYESTGGPIPQHAEYVFRNVPLVEMRLDYDSKIWEARLIPGEGKTQRLLVRNKSSGPQKRCIVHWTVIQ